MVLIEILQSGLHELRWADDLVLEPFPGDTVVRGSLPGLLQVGTYQVLRAESVVCHDGRPWHAYQAEQQSND